MRKKSFLSSIFSSELASRVLTMLAVVSILVVAILLSGPKPVEYSVDATEEPQVVLQNSGNPAADLAELLNEPPITSGVIVGTTAVLVIIFVGTMLEMRRNP